MESVRCNLCGIDDAPALMVGADRVFDIGGAFRVVRCRRCGLVYLNPRPDSKELAVHYPPEYCASLQPQEWQGVAAWKVGIDMVTRRRLPRDVPPGRALEVGCAEGYYLLALRERGWQVAGVEISPEMARVARDEYGLDVRTGAAETTLADYADASFDLVAMWHVLEHVTDPAGVLKQIRRILKPNGRLVLEVPNFRGLSRSMFRTYWAALELPRHLYHFTPTTLRALLTSAGLHMNAVTGVPAAVVATGSLQLVWNRVTGRRGNALFVNQPLIVLCFIPSLMLARMGLSAHMAVEAVKPEAS
jgi:SAM-dependent methyltransferase